MAKSSFSNSQGNCVDVAKVTLHGKMNIRVRSTRNSDPEAYLLFTVEEWTAFLNGTDLGEFDIRQLETVEDPFTVTP